MMLPQSNGVHEDQKVKKTKYDKRAFIEPKDKRNEYGANIRILQRNKDVDTPIKGISARPRTRKTRTPRKKKENQASPRVANHQITLQSVKRARIGAPTASVVPVEPTPIQNGKHQPRGEPPKRPRRPPQPHSVVVSPSHSESPSHSQSRDRVPSQPQPPIAVPGPHPDDFKPTKILQRNKDVDIATTDSSVMSRAIADQPQRQKKSKRRGTTARQIKRDAESAEMENARQMFKDSAIQTAAGAVKNGVSNGHLHNGHPPNQEMNVMMNGDAGHARDAIARSERIKSKNHTNTSPRARGVPHQAQTGRESPPQSPPLELAIATPMHVGIKPEAHKLDVHKLDVHKLDALNGNTSNNISNDNALPQVTLPNIHPITTSPPPAANDINNREAEEEMKKDVLSPSIMSQPLPPSGNLATGTFYASGVGTIQNVKESAYGVKSTSKPLTKVSTSPPKHNTAVTPVPSIPTTPAPTHKPTLTNGLSLLSNLSTSNLLTSVPNTTATVPPILNRQASEATNQILQAMSTVKRSRSELSVTTNTQHQAAPVTRVNVHNVIPSTAVRTSAAVVSRVHPAPTLYPTYNTRVPTATPPKPAPQSAPYPYTYPATATYYSTNPAMAQRTPYPMQPSRVHNVQTLARRPNGIYPQNTSASTLSRQYGVPNQFTNRWTPNTTGSVQSTPGPVPGSQGAAPNGYTTGYGQQRAPYVASTVSRGQFQKQTSYQNVNQNVNRWNPMNGTNTPQNSRTPAPQWNQSNNTGNPQNNGSWNQQNGSWNGTTNGSAPGNRNGNGMNNGPNGRGNGSWDNRNGGNGSWNGSNGRRDDRDYSRYGGPAAELRANTPSRPSRPSDPNVCTWYGTASGCQWGAACFKSHDDPNSRELCPNVNAPWGCKWGNECWFRHETYRRPEDANRVPRRRGASARAGGGGGGYGPMNGGRGNGRDRGGYDDYDNDSASSEISTDESFERDPPSPRSPRSPRRGLSLNPMLESAGSPHSLSSQKSVINVQDLLVQFQDNGEDECTSLHEDGGRCSHLDRMILTLKYYSKWNVVSDAHDKGQFMEFVNEIYVTLLKDYVHIMDKHHDSTDWKKEIDAIYKKWGEEFQSYKPCDLKNNNCLLLDVHRKETDDANSDERKMESEEVEGKQLMFYRDLMDSMHCYLLHQHENGLRIRVTDHNKRVVRKHKKWSDDRFHYEYRIQCNLHDVYVFRTDSCQSRTK